MALPEQRSTIARPNDELERLRRNSDALEQIQVVIDLVARQLNQPFAALSLFDDRYAHYLVTHGKPPSRAIRSEMICDVTFNEGRMIVTLDASQDPTLKDYPVIKNAGTRFYAGTPVYSSEGQKLGVLCAWGKEPGSRVPNDVGSLLTTSAQLISALVDASRSLGKKARERARLEEQLQLQQSLEGIFKYAAIMVDRSGRIQYVTTPFTELVGRRQDDLIGLSLGNLLEATAPLTISEALTQAAETGSSLQCTGRLRSKGQQRQIVDIKVYPESNPEGAVSSFGIRLLPASQVSATSRGISLRANLLQGMRHGAPREQLVEKMIRLVESQVRGCENLAIISTITGPGQREIHASPQSASFIQDLRGHHEFNPAVSICATTAEARQFFSCNDTLDETRWPNYDWLFFTHDIRSVWCAPVLDDAGLIIAVVTVFRREPGAPDKADMQALDELGEWVGLLLFSGSPGTNPEPRKQNLSAKHMATRLKGLSDLCTENEQCYLVALDLSELLLADISPSYIEEIIAVHLGDGVDIFRLKQDTWYCLCRGQGSHELAGKTNSLSDALALDRLMPGGSHQACVRVVFKEATTGQNILDEIATVGRMLLSDGQARIRK